MNDFVPIGEIESRRCAIRLPVGKLQRLSKVSQPTWNRALSATSDTRSGALKSLTAAIVAEEKKLLAYLIALHPELARECLAAQPQTTEAA